MKIAPEGIAFVAVFFMLTVIAVFAFGPKIALIPLALTMFMLYFFRDPERVPPAEPGFVSPADGRIIVIKETEETEYLKQRALMISIFMSPLNVHVNRAPCDGEVMSVVYKAGGYKAAYKDEASSLNESTSMVLKCQSGPILVRQVAGFVARRTVNRKKPGDMLKRGERFGIIKFSSRLDIYLPVDSEVRIGMDQNVRAGETILAAIKK